MDEYYNNRRLGLILAVQAEIEGMKAENEIRKQQKKALSYNGDAFECKADELRNIIYTPNEQL